MNHVSVSPTDGNGPTQGQRKTLTRVGIEPTTFNSHPGQSFSLLPSDLVAQSVERRRSNPKVVGSIPTLVRVFLCPCVGPFPSVGLTLTWFIWDNNNLVSRVNKCLGVLLDEKLTFETHIEYICKKACDGIGALRRIKPFVPLCTLVTLYRSLIQPYFDYCSPLWDTCGKQLKDKLQKIQNRAGGLLQALHMMLGPQMC